MKKYLTTFFVAVLLLALLPGSYKDLALADLKKAADMGLDMARTDHDSLMEK